MLWSLFAAVVGIAVIVGLVITSFTMPQENTLARFFSIGGSVLIVVMVVWFFSETSRNIALPRSHDVAIVGFPESGKTTLLTSLFGEAFAGNIRPIRIIPTGSKTIERVNAHIEQLRKGRTLGPTKDQDRFAFKANLTVKRFPISRNYKVEFGDFPGKDSKTYSVQNRRWLHKTEFFKWAVDSDAMVFVVDIGRYLSSARARQDYVIKMTTSFRATWQHYLDANANKIKEVLRHALVLVFTKADLFGVKEEDVPEPEFEKEIARLGFGDVTPPIQEIDPEALRRGEKRIKNDFSELIQYLEQESQNFHILFCSSFGLLNGKRLGINALLWAALPH